MKKTTKKKSKVTAHSRSILAKLNKEVRDENKFLANWITKNYGPRCKPKEKNCIVCIAWSHYDGLAMDEVK